MMQYIQFEFEGITYEAALVARTESGVWVSLVTIEPAWPGRLGVKRFLPSDSYKEVETRENKPGDDADKGA